MPPALSISIFAASQSTHITLWPTSAKHVPVTNPTYPVPMMLIFMNPTLDSQGRPHCSTCCSYCRMDSGVADIPACHRAAMPRTHNSQRACADPCGIPRLEQRLIAGHGGVVDFAGTGFAVFKSNGGGFAVGALDRVEGNTGAGGLVGANS